MRVLLDESLPRRLKRDLEREFDVFLTGLTLRRRGFFAALTDLLG